MIFFFFLNKAQRLYWINSVNHSIEYSDSSGLNRAKIFLSSIVIKEDCKPISLSVSGSTLYVVFSSNLLKYLTAINVNTWTILKSLQSSVRAKEARGSGSFGVPYNIFIFNLNSGEDWSLGTF